MPWNTAAGKGNNDQLVCGTPEGTPLLEGAADGTNSASAVLGSRKRVHCWSGGPDNCDQALGTVGAPSTNMYWWAEEAYRLQVQVNVGGRIVHPGGGSTRRIEVNSQIWFRVRWQERLYPNAGSGCEGTGNACTVVAGEAGATFV